MVTRGRAVILGAGMSGLVLGLELAKKDWDVTIVEKNDSVGGLARTFRFADFYIDLGPHLFHTSSSAVASYWEGLFGDEFQATALYGQNLADGELFDYPLTRDSLQQLPREIQQAIEMESQALPDLEKMATAASYREYITALAGPTLQKMFYEDYPRKLWGIETSNLSANWAPARIEIREKRRPFHSDHWSAVAKNGCGKILEILAEQFEANGGTLRLETEVSRLITNSSRVEGIEILEGDVIPLDFGDLLISTLPIHISARALSIETSLSFRKIKVVSFVLSGEDPLPPTADWIYVKEPATIFHRVGSQTRFSRHGIADGLHIVSAEVAYDSGDEIDVMPDEELVTLVENQLRSLPRINLNGTLVDSYVFDAGDVYPRYALGYEAELRRVQSEFEKYANFHTLGSPAEFAYSDLQVVTAKALDLASYLAKENPGDSPVRKTIRRTKGFSREIRLGRAVIGDDRAPEVIAEIGLNHNGNVELAKSMMKSAKLAGSSLIKLQSFLPGRMSSTSDAANYAEDLIGLEESLPKLLDRVALTEDQTRELFDYANDIDVDLFSTPFDLHSVQVLESLGVNLYKISSMDTENLPLLQSVAETGKPVIVSTGMTTLAPLEQIVDIFETAGNRDLIFLHCVSSYPASASETNLRAIGTIKSAFGTIVGFSDHHPDVYLLPAAVALGARLFEKHFTIDKGLKGPDHFFSLEPQELAKANEISRSAFHALGDGRKTLSPSEQQARRMLKRSIFASQDLPSGEVLAPEHLTIKSPGTGISPNRLEEVIGRRLARPVSFDSPINWEDLE